MKLLTARNLLWFNAILSVVWALLLVPTLLWWQEAVLWVALMSLWANFASHVAGYVAARGDKESEKLEKKLDRVLEILETDG